MVIKNKIKLYNNKKKYLKSGGEPELTEGENVNAESKQGDNKTTSDVVTKEEGEKEVEKKDEEGEGGDNETNAAVVTKEEAKSKEGANEGDNYTNAAVVTDTKAESKKEGNEENEKMTIETLNGDIQKHLDDLKNHLEEIKTETIDEKDDITTLINKLNDMNFLGEFDKNLYKSLNKYFDSEEFKTVEIKGQKESTPLRYRGNLSQLVYSQIINGKIGEDWPNTTQKQLFKDSLRQSSLPDFSGLLGQKSSTETKSDDDQSKDDEERVEEEEEDKIKINLPNNPQYDGQINVEDNNTINTNPGAVEDDGEGGDDNDVSELTNNPTNGGSKKIYKRKRKYFYKK